METSLYQELKLTILSLLQLSKDAVHIHLGLFVFFLFLLLFRKNPSDLRMVIPVAIVACSMEALDLYHDFQSFGYFHWRASIHDIINTTFWPVSIVFMAKAVKYERKQRA